MDGIIIRTARDEDSKGLIDLIGAVFAEYPGCVFDVDAEMPELRQPASAASADSGRWWVAELDGRIVGSVAVVPDEQDGILELKKLYVSSTARKRGLGAHLVKLAESEAHERAAKSMVLWTDTRFLDAHKLYSRLGFVRAPRTRVLNDLSNTVEFHFTKDLGT
jgi:N-acetylglutamate synthase-like GNAT family acetyltransferase